MEVTRDLQAAIEYVQKEDTRVMGPWRHGNIPVKSDKGELTIRTARTLSREEKEDLSVHRYIAVQRAIAMHKADTPSTFEGPRECFWVYGNPGTGKSRMVKEMNPYDKPLSKWWCGYDQQEVVLIDDFEKDSLKYLAHYLKRWADPYGKLDGEVKGGKVALNYKKLYVTTNYTIEECCEFCFPGDEQLLKALKRRF